MKLFDLKKFREDTGLTQQEFADKIDYSQASISRIEGEEKPISDKLLMKIEDTYGIDLDGYKKYERNKKVGATKSDGGGIHLHSDAYQSELENKYRQLQEEKSRLDNEFYTLSEEHKHTAIELLLIKENNTLLRKVVANTEELLLKITAMERGTNV